MSLATSSFSYTASADVSDVFVKTDWIGLCTECGLLINLLACNTLPTVHKERKDFNTFQVFELMLFSLHWWSNRTKSAVLRVNAFLDSQTESARAKRQRLLFHCMEEYEMTPEQQHQRGWLPIESTCLPQSPKRCTWCDIYSKREKETEREGDGEEWSGEEWRGVEKEGWKWEWERHGAWWERESGRKKEERSGERGKGGLKGRGWNGTLIASFFIH